MIFKQFQTIKIFHVQYPPPSSPPWSFHEHLVWPTHCTVWLTCRAWQPRCHAVRPTSCVVRSIQPPLKLLLHSQQKCFQLFQGQKHFFQKVLKYWSSIQRKQKIFLSLSRGGVRPQSDKNHFFFEAFPYLLYSHITFLETVLHLQMQKILFRKPLT